MKVNIDNQDKETKYEDGRMTVDGIDFDGHSVIWSFGYEACNYLKESEISGDEYRKGGTMWIKRNGVSVFKQFCRTPERAFVVLAYTLPKLQDFPFECLQVGRKIYNMGIPATIERFCGDGEMIVVSEDGSEFPWPHELEEKKKNPGHKSYWGAKDRVHILSDHLSFFRT